MSTVDGAEDNNDARSVEYHFIAATSRSYGLAMIARYCLSPIDGQSYLDLLMGK